MTRRADYLAANRGLRAPMPGFVLLVRPRRDDDPIMRIGITVSGKVGGAVIRNRMKRRFRELARAILPGQGIPGADHILIGRREGIERDYGLLRAELEKGLTRLRSKASPVKASGPSTGLAELVEAPSFSASGDRKRKPSTSSGKPGAGGRAGAGEDLK